jgi:orc1/cdc6 family replication initiation protein
MITDSRVLEPEFVPSDVVHRDAEINTLSAALDPITRGEPGETAFLSGPSGAGKTCIARHTLDKLDKQVLDLDTGYVNCWEDRTRFKILYRVLEAVDNTYDIHRQSTPTDALIDRLHDRDGPPTVVILDEVDQLEDTSVLYDLSRTRHLTMILIANREEEFYARVDGRLESRLQSAARIRFSQYGDEELIGILRDRVRWGLAGDVVDDTQLRTIADAAAGDARAAIGILRTTARRAVRSGDSTIKADHIRKAVPEAKAELRQKDVEKLTPDQRILYEVVQERGKVDPSDLYSEYRERAEDPKSRRMLRNHLQKLRHYNLIEAKGATRGRTYRAVEGP